MPVVFRTESRSERLASFSGEVPAEDLYAFFTLTGADRAAIPARSAPANRLGFASSCAVRYLGFCQEDLSAGPGDVARYVTEHPGILAEAPEKHGEQPQTRTDHLLDEPTREAGERRVSRLQPPAASLARTARRCNRSGVRI